MTELEQLRADLATLEASRDLLEKQGCPNIALRVQSICELTEKRIADLEAQQATEDKWKQARAVLFAWEIKNKVLNYEEKQLVLAYVRELQHQVAELDDELRCERIDGGKVRDDLKARIAEMEQHGRKVDQANHEHYGRLQDQIAIRDLKIEKLERQAPAERNRENLAELVTIQNAIPPACGLARELVERRIEEVKEEMQG